jgi:hypothetical protein
LLWGDDVNDNPQTDIFLARALEAVEEAAATRRPAARAQWLKIAEAWRELADSKIRRVKRR